MEIIGKTTINPLIFYSGKIAGYMTWIILFLLLIDIEIIDRNILFHNNIVSLIVLVLGLSFTVISLINLGKSTRLGLPSDDTKLKTIGIYKLSRNPMYVGFNLITISAIVFTLNWVILISGVYSMIVYHLIIKGEEQFMTQKFGQEYKMYQSKVRRYL